MTIALVTDSTSDLKEAANITIVPLSVHFNQQNFKDWIDITPKTIFDGVAQGYAPPNTSQPSPEAFRQAYATALETHDHVLVLTLSSGLSGTFNSASLAAQEFSGKITVFDSKSACSGLAMMVLRAQEMLTSNNSLDGVLVELERIRSDSFVQFSVASLDMLKRNGRINTAQALLGNLLGIKPILGLEAGLVVPRGRARGEKKAIAEIANHFAAWAQGRGRIRAFFIYSVDPEASKPLRDAVAALNLPISDGYNMELGAVIASHSGPGTYGLFAYSY